MENDEKITQPVVLPSTNADVELSKPPNNKRKVIVVAVVLVVAALVAVIGYKLYADNNTESTSTSKVSTNASMGFTGKTETYSDNVVSFKYPQGWQVKMSTFPTKPDTYYLSINSDYVKGTLASTGSPVQFRAGTFIIIKPSGGNVVSCEGCSAQKNAPVSLAKPKGPFQLVLGNATVQAVDGQGGFDGDLVATINSSAVTKNTKNYTSFINVTSSQKMTLQTYPQYTTDLDINLGGGNYEDKFKPIKLVNDYEKSPLYSDLKNILSSFTVK